MPLDTGALPDAALGRAGVASRGRPVLDPNLEVGAALRAARESLRLGVEEIAEITRVKVRHIEAIEVRALDQLPSRPFTIGYVRAYAKALGLDADQVAQRFRSENPSPDDDELHSPVGVAHDAMARNSSLTVLAIVAVVAIIGWNIARHATADTPKKLFTPRHAAAAEPARNAAAPPGVFDVNAPLPAPPEATAPPSYQTPIVGPDGATNAILPPKPATPVNAAPSPFVAAGTIYGPTKGASNLIIQARKSISLEVRAGDTVYFARQLAAGEAYRVPNLPGLTAEVSNPDNAELFEGGVSKGVFTAPQMPLKTASSPAPAAHAPA